MVERIRLLLETRQLTPTQFADVIGVARPIVSHILSGRNKPSLEVVQRILGAMPDLSMAWLLNGTGPMLAGIGEPAATATPVNAPLPPATAHKPSKATAAVTPAAPAPTAVSVPDATPAPQPPARAKMAANLPIPKRFAPASKSGKGNEDLLPNSASAPSIAPAVAPESPQAPPASVAAAPPTANEAPLAAALAAGSEKAIRRIVIFYQDGSFSDFRPE